MSGQQVAPNRPVLRLDEHELRCLASDGGIKLLEQLDGGVGLISTWADLERGRGSLLARGLLAEDLGSGPLGLAPVAGFRELLQDLAAPDRLLFVLDREPSPRVRIVVGRGDREHLLAAAEPTDAVADVRSGRAGPERDAPPSDDDRPNLVVEVTPIRPGATLEAALGDLLGPEGVESSRGPGAELQMSVTVWDAVLHAVAAGSVSDASLHLRACGAATAEVDDLVTALSAGIGAGGLTAQRHFPGRIVQDDIGWIHTLDRSRWWLVESRTTGAVTITPTTTAGVVARAHALMEELS